MSKIRLSAAVLLGIGIAIGFFHPLAVSQSSASSQPPLKEIHVDRSCKILPDQSNALSDYTQAEIQNDDAICHRDGPNTSHHIEEALRDGMRLRSKVTVIEQEYLLQNVTSEPVTFVVEYALPDGWKIDSDPQPVKIADGTAFFRMNVKPGQILRLHVGQRHTDPITDAN